MILSRASVKMTGDRQEQHIEGLELFSFTANDGDIHQYMFDQIPAHWHKELEIFRLLSGKVRIGIGSETIDLQKNEGCFINTRMLHSFTALTKDPCHYQSFVFDPAIVGGAPGSIFDVHYVRPLLDHGPACLRFQVKEREKPAQEETVSTKKNGQQESHSIINGEATENEMSESAANDCAANKSVVNDCAANDCTANDCAADDYITSAYKVNDYGADVYTVNDYFDMAFRAAELEHPGYEFTVRYALSSMLLLLCRSGFAGGMGNAAEAASKQDERLLPMLDWVGDNLEKLITVSDIAAAANVSVRECQRIFRQYLHCTPMQYLRQKRLREAAGLLASSDLTITEISMKYNFSNPSHFSREFRTFTGSTPAAFRRAARQKI